MKGKIGKLKSVLMVRISESGVLISRVNSSILGGIKKSDHVVVFAVSNIT